MPIRIQSFGGPLVWFCRKNFSNTTSKIMLSVTERVRKKRINRYIDYFLKCEEIPPFKFIMIETVNRCNGTCSFCPANVKSEKRPFKKISDELFDKIIDELKSNNWQGGVFLQVNNEPFVDVRIYKFAKQIREKLPESKVRIITNGTLLKIESFQDLKFLVDEIIINDYSETYKLGDNIKSIYKYLKKHKQEFKHINICINRRYAGEILATRAGTAPNKPIKNNKVNAPCIYPFTDMIIYPDGVVGICCNDCYETTKFGDVNEQSLFDIWKGERFCELRAAMKNGRDHYVFCKECDVVDAGSRENIIKL